MSSFNLDRKCMQKSNQKQSKNSPKRFKTVQKTVQKRYKKRSCLNDNFWIVFHVLANNKIKRLVRNLEIFIKHF